MQSLNIPIGAIQEITLWYRMNVRGGFSFNHIEEGHINTEKPTQKHANQDGWVKSNWVKEFAWLSGDNPPKVLSDPESETQRILITSIGPI